MKKLLLRVDNVSKKFESSKYDVISDLSITLKESQLIYLIGENGCGKSTLLKLIAGLIRPDRGEICTFTRKRKGVHAWLHTDKLFSDFPIFSPYETISYFAQMFGIRWSKAARNEAKRLLEDFGLHFDKSKCVSELSKGMKQKLNICCSLIIKPEILLMDEPTSGLDKISTRILSSKLKDLLTKYNSGIILATHDQELVDIFPGDIIGINKGKVICLGEE